MANAKVLPSSSGHPTLLGLGQIIPASLGLIGLVATLTLLADRPRLSLLVALIAISVLLLVIYTTLDIRSATPLLGMRLYRDPEFVGVPV